MSYLQVQELARIENEFEAVKASVGYLERLWPGLINERDFRGLKFLQVQAAAANIEITYIVRPFSVFESILRDILPVRISGGPDRRSVYDLINRSASKWRISVAVRDEAHQIREFRNQFVHHNNVNTSPVLFADAVAALNRFLIWLP